MKKPFSRFSFPSAFTLVELIVVIAVLAVLAAISFSTVANITSGARDSARLTDISSMKTSLETYNATKWGFPMPDNATAITWSGNLAWSQGTFGDNTSRALNTISRPKDPKWNVDYSYSVSNSKKEYEIATVLEKTTSFNGISKVYAQGEQYDTVIKGNYNGVALRISSAISTWILSVPTLIASDIKDAKLENIIFSYPKSGNLPFSYTGSVASPQAVPAPWIAKQVWSGALVLPKSDSELQQFTTDLKTAYTGSPAASSETIKSLLATTDNKGYGNNMVNRIGGNVVVNTSIAGNSDPYSASIVSLLHFDGNLTDTTGKVWTANGGVSTTSAKSKFGSKSLLVTTGTNISINGNTDFNFGTSAFTIECWVYTESLNAYVSLFGEPTYNFYMFISKDANHAIVYSPTGRIDSSIVWTSGVWNHVAFIWDGNGHQYLTINGILVGSTNSLANIPQYPTYIIGNTPGQYGGGSDITYLNEFRISKGVARWTVFPFTPPTGPSS